MLYDLIIIGAGPSGLTAAIYARRALLKTLIFEKSLAGGKLNKTENVDNYPGFKSIKGVNLAEKMVNHVKIYKIDWKYEEVVILKKNKNFFSLKTNDGNEFITKAIIIASGAIENKLKIKGEEEFFNLGVSYCALCDGFLFRNKSILVVGGGYSSLETALYMSNIANKVYLVHRRGNFNTDREIIEKIKNAKITIFFNSILTEIKGKKKVNSVNIFDLVNNKNNELYVDAIFPCIGLSPLSNLSHELGITDQQDYIVIDSNCSTSIPGIFAAGDVARTNKDKIKQIVTAISEGAVAAQSAIKYLKYQYLKCN